MRVASFLRLGVVIVVVAILAGGAVALWPNTKQKHLTAYFTNTVGLYPGADVRILGIKVGNVDSVTPAGTSVRVTLHYDAKYKVPATAQAVIINQALVSDRYVQLTPVYTGGSVLANGATLSVSQTVVPVEIDDISASLNNLGKALGPQGANANGALSQLLHVTADNLGGEGDQLHQTISDSARVLQTLSNDRGDITSTIKNLQTITGTLAANDNQTRGFIDNLDAVSGQLSDERGQLAQALQVLGPTLQNLTRFIRGNQTELANNVRQLAQVTSVLVKEKGALGKFLVDGPLGVDNLAHAYDPLSGTLDSRTDLQQLKNPAMWLCSLAYSLGAPPKQCESLLAPLNSISKGLNLSLDLSWITALTTDYKPVCPPPDAYPPGYKGPVPPPGCVVDPGALKPAGKDPAKTLGGLFPGGTP
jgi:phospholipid/cholesterol/gamma-HCH transport system substrate-binding protein